MRCCSKLPSYAEDLPVAPFDGDSPIVVVDPVEVDFRASMEETALVGAGY